MRPRAATPKPAIRIREDFVCMVILLMILFCGAIFCFTRKFVLLPLTAIILASRHLAAFHPATRIYQSR
jgi:hypothetical protein